MGLFGKLFGSFGSGDGEVDIFDTEETCPYCGDTMRGEGQRFECPNCGVLFEENGEYVHPWERSRHSTRTCVNCGESLSGGTQTLPWEDGDNAYAYITCPNCGYKNIQEGFGEDD